MASNYLTGTAYWAKVIGPARKNNFDDYHEWTIDVCPDKEGLALLKQLGVADRLKDPKANDPRGDDRFITFRQKAERADGTKNDPIRIVDGANHAWPDRRLIGNGSKVDIKFNVKDYGPGKKKGVYIQAIRVLEHVPFEGQDFEPLSEDSEYFENWKSDDEDPSVTPDFEKDFGLEEKPQEDDLNDDIPTA